MQTGLSALSHPTPQFAGKGTRAAIATLGLLTLLPLGAMGNANARSQGADELTFNTTIQANTLDNLKLRQDPHAYLSEQTNRLKEDIYQLATNPKKVDREAVIERAQNLAIAAKLILPDTPEGNALKDRLTQLQADLDNVSKRKTLGELLADLSRILLLGIYVGIYVGYYARAQLEEKKNP